jgi:hypothetical protein
MTDPTSGEQALLTTASMRRMAMRIVELPKDNWDDAFEVAERSFEEAVKENKINPERGRLWIEITLRALRALVSDMDMRGGARGGHA